MSTEDDKFSGNGTRLWYVWDLPQKKLPQSLYSVNALALAESN